jgi:tRNA(Arg) A34 adenosine deaminase TadA
MRSLRILREAASPGITKFYGAERYLLELDRTKQAYDILNLSLRFQRGPEQIRMLGKANPEFLRRATSLATENVVTGRGGPFAAVIVRDGKIVGEGVNTVTASHDPTAHGEVNAIRAATRALGKFTLAGCELYTSCEPCPMCLAAAYWARLDAIYFGASAADAARAGFDDAFLYEEMRKNLGERSLPSSQLIGGEAWASFAAWLASPNKIEY